MSISPQYFFKKFNKKNKIMDFVISRGHNKTKQKQNNLSILLTWKCLAYQKAVEKNNIEWNDNGKYDTANTRVAISLGPPSDTNTMQRRKK